MAERALQPQIAVIGGGATGLGAALAARRAGAEVVLIERDRLGGECTWTGCIPSKTMIEYARQVHHARRLGLAGQVDSAAVLQRARDVAHTIGREEDADALAGAGIRVVAGHARFVAPDELAVDGTRIRPQATIIATGSTAEIPQIDGLRGVGPLTNDDLFTLDRLPRRLAVLGAGAVALELGQACARLGCQVDLVDTAPRVAAAEEPETSSTLTSVLVDERVGVHTGVRLDRVRPTADGVALLAADRTVASADRVLVAAGRRPVTDGLDLHRAGLTAADDGSIPVDRRMRTAVSGVLAAGDVTGYPRLTHAGYRMGQIAVHTALRRTPWRFAPAALPWAIFTDPEVGRVGLTEAQAFARWGDRARVAMLPLAGTDRARTAGVTDGFVKLVAAPHPVARDLLGGRLVGATVVCPTGGDVIGELALAVRTRTTPARLARTVHAYPTWSLAVWEAVARFLGPHRATATRAARAT